MPFKNILSSLSFNVGFITDTVSVLKPGASVRRGSSSADRGDFEHETFCLWLSSNKIHPLVRACLLSTIANHL